MKDNDVPGTMCALSHVLEGLSWNCISSVLPDEVVIAGITADSREVKSGFLFFALVGLQSDGHDFIESAVEAGCTALLVEQGKWNGQVPGNVCVIEVDDTHNAFGEVAAAYYGHPAREMNFIGITGTNGKTTVTYLLETILENLSYSVGVIGTVNYRFSNRAGEKMVLPAPFTTPEPLILQKLLREMANEGVRYVLMEVSSHALAQKRIGDVQYDVAVFTNLSHDHLDYHDGMDEYFQAKTVLFSDHLKEDGSAIIQFGEDDNTTDCWPERLVSICEQEKIQYIKRVGYESGSVHLVNMDAHLGGTKYRLFTEQGEVEIQSPLAGKFNVANSMAAVAVALELGFDVQDIASGLALGQGAPGRVQHVEVPESLADRPFVFVDYAHTPDALEKVLQTLSSIPHNDLVCVFGCGGDRDNAKRAVMGKVAGELCDVVVVTDDNPRTEDPAFIISQVVHGVNSSGLQEKNIEWAKSRDQGDRGYIIQPGRSEAIDLAIRMSAFNDIVVVAGKGHERYQITQDGRKFFDDVLASQEALISWKVQDIERALNCTAIQAESVEILQKVSTDTRALEKGDIFVALRGDNFDAHNFLDKAVAAGAGILVIEKSHILEEHIKVPVIQVDDTLVALGDLASYRRKVLAAMTKPVVVGLTGSSGKTTVKEMVASIFNEHWPDVETEPSKRVLKTQGNFNNLIGLPLSLLPFRAKHKVAVLEMGMNSPGEIARLVEIAVPDISCINNIHAAHLEGLHTIDGVARAKDEIFSGTPETSILVVNLDDVRVRNCAKKYGNKKISFTATSEGLVYSPDLWASNVSLNRKGCARFVLHVGEKVHQVVLSVPGEHNVSNALAAAAIAHGASVPIAVIASGLKKFKSVDKRMMMVTSHSGISVLNDTYNANPASMEAGLETLTQLADESSVAVLGDMLELGEASAELHHEIGAKAAEKGVSYVAAFGSFSSDIVQGAREGGMSAEASREFKDKQELLQWLLELRQNKAITERAWILVKASRGMQFETIVEGLMENV